MILYHSHLSEKDRRHYAAVEAAKLGRGGTTYISRLLGISRTTIIEGKKQLQELSVASGHQPALRRQRKPGAGGKKKTYAPDIKELLSALIEAYKGGSPTDPDVYWICLRPPAIARLFQEQHGIAVSHAQVKRLLKELGYRYRRQSKQLATGASALRDQQFQIICAIVLLMSTDSPVLSIDCKKKERLGNLYRSGRCYCTGALKVYDHDYEHLSEGKVIPHGIYDMGANKGYLSIGGSAETAEFVTDNLLWWWTEHGIHMYPDAKNILLLCDAGGANRNSYRHHIFKRRLMAFARETGLSVVVCHYPPYCSKWNTGRAPAVLSGA